MATSNTSLGRYRGSSQRPGMDCVWGVGCGVAGRALKCFRAQIIPSAIGLLLRLEHSQAGVPGSGGCGLPLPPTPRGSLHLEISFHLGSGQSVQEADQRVSTWVPLSLPRWVITHRAWGLTPPLCFSFLPQSTLDSMQVQPPEPLPPGRVPSSTPLQAG